MPEVPAVLAAEDSLIPIYQAAWDRIVAAQAELASDPLQARKRARLAEMKRTVESALQGLREATNTWLEDDLPRLYTLGGAEGAAAVASEFTWTAISQEAVEELAGTMWQELLDATSYVDQSTKSLIRKIGQDVALSKAIEGRTAVEAGRAMSRLMAKEGIAAVVYKNGARHGLGEYAEMAIRTTTAKAYNYGTLNGAAAGGCEYWEVFDGPNCGWSAHDAGEQALGKIVTRDEALAYPISHPNCRRAFGARPDITSKADAKAAQGGQVTPSQVEAQRAQDAQRQERQARRALRQQATARRRDGLRPTARVEERAARVAERRAQRQAARQAGAKPIKGTARVVDRSTAEAFSSGGAFDFDVLHGTRAHADILENGFNYERLGANTFNGGMMGAGAYVSDTYQTARGYGLQGEVLAMRTRVKNPVEMGSKAFQDVSTAVQDLFYYNQVRPEYAAMFEPFGGPEALRLSLENVQFPENHAMVALFRQQGYDSAVYKVSGADQFGTYERFEEIAIFDPNDLVVIDTPARLNDYGNTTWRQTEFTS